MDEEEGQNQIVTIRKSKGHRAWCNICQRSLEGAEAYSAVVVRWNMGQTTNVEIGYCRPHYEEMEHKLYMWRLMNKEEVPNGSDEV